MGKSPNEIKVLLGKSSINDGFSIAMFEPAGGEPYQRFAVFFWGVVLRGGILGGVITFCRLYIIVFKRSGWYAIKIGVCFDHRSSLSAQKIAATRRHRKREPAGWIIRIVPKGFDEYI